MLQGGEVRNGWMAINRSDICRCCVCANTLPNYPPVISTKMFCVSLVPVSTLINS
jgi:hypothetical protein